MEDFFFSRFTWITRGEPRKWEDVRPSFQFPINNGVSVDGTKCFDQLIDLGEKIRGSEKVVSTTKSSSVYWHTASGPAIFEK
jgi:hypothetical protein